MQFIVQGGHPVRHHPSIGQQERRAADHLRRSAHRPAGHPRKRPAHPRRRDARRAHRVGRCRRRLGRRAQHARIHAKTVRAASLDPVLCRKIRASILLAGPLLARCGQIELPPPGGDVIGRRRVDTHFLALERLGASFELTDSFRLSTPGLRGADVFLDEPSVTGTENALIGRRRRHGHDGPPQRRVRAARPGSLRTFSSRSARNRRYRHEHS